MSIKTVLTITGPAQSKIDLRLAAQLCGEIRAHLSVMVTAFALPPPIGDYPPAGEDWAKQRDRDLTNLKRRTGEVTRIPRGHHLVHGRYGRLPGSGTWR